MVWVVDPWVGWWHWVGQVLPPQVDPVDPQVLPSYQDVGLQGVVGVVVAGVQGVQVAALRVPLVQQV